MTTMAKLALGMMGKLRPQPALGACATSIVLPPPQRDGGLSLMQALVNRRSDREFAPDPLPLSLLSSLLWAAYGVNRPDGGRTAPLALNAQEVDVFIALPGGAYRYDAARHELRLVAGTDVRRVTGYQDFVDEAPLDLWSMWRITRAWAWCRSRNGRRTRTSRRGPLRRTCTCLPLATGWPRSFAHGSIGQRSATRSG